MTGVLTFAVVVLWLVVLALCGVIVVLVRQIGVLYERVAPVGALMDTAGPKVGEAAPVIVAPSLTGGEVALGAAASSGSASGRSTLVFFLSPTCPVCKTLLPALAHLQEAEQSWLDVVLASDGDEARHRAFIETAGLARFPYVLSSELGMAYRVQRLPYAVLIDGAGLIRAKGLVNSREQLESLFNAVDAGVTSMQELLSRRTAAE